MPTSGAQRMSTGRPASLPALLHFVCSPPCEDVWKSAPSVGQARHLLAAAQERLPCA